MLDVIVFLCEVIPVIYSYFFTSWTTFFIGLAIIYTIHVVLPSLFGLEHMTGSDAVWYGEIPTNLRYNQGALIVDRMTAEEAKSILTTRGLSANEKFQKTSVRIFGRQFWKKEKDFSADKHFTHYTKPVKSMDELYAFKEELFIQTIPEDLAQWQMHFIEFYESDKSVLIFKSHHSLCDGLALISLIVSTSDPKETKENYIRFNRKNFLMQLSFYIKSIIMFPILAIIVFTRKEPMTPIHGKALSGKKSVAVSSDIPLNKLKAYCLKENISINTCVLGGVCAGIQRYLSENNCYLKELTVIIPFSMRMLPDDNSALPLINDISFLVTPVPLNISEHSQRSRIFHELCEKLKHSSEPFANNISQKIIGAVFPYTLRRHFVNDFGSRTSFFFTNVPGPKGEVTYHGKKVHKIFFASPTTGTNALTVSSFSYNGTLSIGVTCDKAVIREAKDVVKCIEKEMEIIY